jgi:hypothetical protein
MITAITPEPAVSGTYSTGDYRFRSAMGERTVLADSAPPASKNSNASGDGKFPEGDRQAPPQPEPPRRDSSSMFAAAVIAGALSPTPKTMEELMLRIGTSTIPEESEARLKDLLA